MGLLNGRRRSLLIDEVVVPASTVYPESDPHNLPLHVSMFVNHALSFSAEYVCDELPREALLAAHVALYVGEVNNGGHAQFVGNIDWDAEIRAHIREGLATLGLDEAGRIFADLEAFAVAEPRGFERISGGAYEIETFFFALDDRFNGPVADSIVAANTAWIKTRSWLRTIPDADYYRIRGWETPPHPLREARIEARRRRHRPAWLRFYARLRDRLSRD
jgi:hypothetical protein